MGSGRDKRKKAKGKVPGHGEGKTARKTELNQTKAERRTAKKIEVFLRFFGVCFCAHMETYGTEAKALLYQVTSSKRVLHTQ